MVVSLCCSDRPKQQKPPVAAQVQGALAELPMTALNSCGHKVYCFFQSENLNSSRGILGVFTAGGMAPKLIIMNSTYHDGFPFKLSLFNSRVLWVLDIPRRSITIRKNIAAVEEWTIKITMHQGLNIYETEGTLLDLVRATGFQKFIKVDNEHKLGTFYENCMTTKVAVGTLGEELKNYIVRMTLFYLCGWGPKELVEYVHFSISLKRMVSLNVLSQNHLTMKYCEISRNNQHIKKRKAGTVEEVKLC
ncbi:hypothetical protein U0070_025722, partial [Myodes glareolus]